MKPGGRSKRPVPPLPSTAPFTVAEKVSTTTAGRELWRQGMSQLQQWQLGESQDHGREGDMFTSGAKLPCPVLFQDGTRMGEEHRKCAGRQKTDSTGQTDSGGGRKNRAWSLPSYGGCFTGRCRLLGSTHHLGGLCWLQHKMPARGQTQSRVPAMSRMHHRRAACRWEGHRNVPLTIQEHPSGQAIPAQKAARENAG